MEQQQFDLLIKHLRAMIGLQVLQISTGIASMNPIAGKEIKEATEFVLKKYNLQDDE